MTNKDRVSVMFGEHVADTLDAEGLIRPDLFGVDAEPTHWRVTVTYPAGTSYFQMPHSLLNELKQQYRAHAHQVSHVFDNLKKAKRNTTMLTNAGFNVKLTPLVLLEVKETK